MSTTITKDEKNAKIRRYAGAYRAKNKEKIAAYHRAYKANNKEYFAAYYEVTEERRKKYMKEYYQRIVKPKEQAARVVTKIPRSVGTVAVRPRHRFSGQSSAVVG